MIEALHDKIVVIVPEAGKTVGGLHLPEGVKTEIEKYTCIVDSVGSKVETKIEKGDKVLCMIAGGLGLKLEGVQYFIIKEDLLLGKIK